MINDEEPKADAAFQELLGRYHAAESDAKQAIGEEIVKAIQKYFDKHLRPGIGRKFSASKQDSSLRYTAMVNTFFAEVLSKQPNRLWRAKSLRALRNFAATVISHDILDVLRRQKLRGSLGEDDLDDLACARAEHFRTRHQLDLQDALLRLDVWAQRKEPWPQRGRVLRHRYIGGMSYEEIAQQEECTIERVYQLKEDAIKALKREIFAHQDRED